MIQRDIITKVETFQIYSQIIKALVVSNSILIIRKREEVFMYSRACFSEDESYAPYAVFELRSSGITATLFFQHYKRANIDRTVSLTHQ